MNKKVLICLVTGMIAALGVGFMLRSSQTEDSGIHTYTVGFRQDNDHPVNTPPGMRLN